MPEDFKVTPWEVTGEIDYDLLQQRFGTTPIDDALLERLARYGDLHYMLRRGIFYSHRDMIPLLDEYDKGNRFVLYTGRGPSGNTHLGHIMPWIFNKWVQDTFGVEMLFQLTDDEKFLFKDLTLEDTGKMAYENALDFIALGFDPKKTRIIVNTKNVDKLYPVALKVAKKVTFSTAKAVFGFENSTNIGSIFYTTMQSVPAFLPTDEAGKQVPVLIPCGIDQDPHFRVTRDVAPGLGYPKPSLIYCKMCPGLAGGDKMSSSDENATIFTTDTPKAVKKKVGRAFTGGCVSVEEQRQKGGNPEVCSVFKYNYFLFEHDDEKINELADKCRKGEILCGECKMCLTERINVFLEQHQDKREKAKDSLEVEVMGAASWLESKGLAKLSESSERFYVLADQSVVDGLPERVAVNLISEAGGSMDMDALAQAMSGGMDKVAVGWLKRKGLADIVKDGDRKNLVLTDKGRAVLGERMPDEELIQRMSSGPVPEAEADPKVVKDLKGRQGMIAEKVVTARSVSLTDLGKEAASLGIELKPQITDITDRIIQSGEWRDAEFRKYDIQTFAPSVYAAKKHMLSRLEAQVSRIFTEMGFTEMSSEYVQPSFWNMDVLYTPQDHPARDLQDTFYLEHPASIHIDDEKMVETIRNIHENGGDTGSTGWGGHWSREKAEAAILRTHSTVSSIKFIAEHPDAPQKAFSISRIFRKESIDSTHLPEFTQIEGIIIDENANFDMLISLIREFYSRMGFDQIRIRPAYFPYTEPSLELEVFFNGKWMELGGAGIFRPEVVAPFGVKYPVLAWGFGFERLAMLKWDIKDIRDLYISDMDTLKTNAVL